MIKVNGAVGLSLNLRQGAALPGVADAPACADGARLVSYASAARPQFVAQWDALARRASEPNPFYESWYLLPSMAELADGKEISIFAVYAAGRLAGILPVMRAPRYYGHPIPNMAGWVHPNSFLGAPLVLAGSEQQFYESLFDWADRNCGTSLFLHFASLPLDGPLYDALHAVTTKQGRTAGVVKHQERAKLCSRLSPAQYLEAALSGKKRKELRRQKKRLGELGNMAIVRSEGSDGIGEWTAAFLALESAGWKGTAGSALSHDAGTRTLFKQALAGAAERGILDRLSITLGGKPIAMLATFICREGSFAYKTAFDETYSRFSPGVLLQCENLDLLDRKGLAWCDSCAAADHPMIDHIWRERRGVGCINVAIGGKLRRSVFGQLLRRETRNIAAGIANPGSIR
ncbi:GNAT family N-acetyltransferase [Altererythrobacter aquiaggeris]|uniref:GNAT family N-acetyltransferase n=1 Tax=Aestuarierythrobacter aquiaggeris TaxID=1898396 RepID=UPI003017EA9E